MELNENHRRILKTRNRKQKFAVPFDREQYISRDMDTALKELIKAKWIVKLDTVSLLNAALTMGIDEPMDIFHADAIRR